MTTDPPRRDDDPEDTEAHRAAALHDLERWAARQPPPAPGQQAADAVHLVTMILPGQDAPVRALLRWSLAARLQRDAAALGVDHVTDLGPAAGHGIGTDPARWAPGQIIMLRPRREDS
jgi:hypothetical protein